MAPEVADGTTVSKEHQGKKDIWAVGVMLHMLLTGRAPFKGKNDQQTINWLKEKKDLGMLRQRSFSELRGLSPEL